MNYEDMFIGLVGVLFVFNLFITFFGLAMPEAAPKVLPSGFSAMDYNQSSMTQDFNKMKGATSGASASSSGTGSNFTFGLEGLGQAWDIFLKLASNTLFGYYNIGIAIADAVEESSTGAIHFLLGGIGLIFSILVIYGLLLFLRSIIVRV